MSDSSDSSESSDNEQLDQPMAIDEIEQYKDEEELNRLQENEFNARNADLKSLQHVDVFLKQLPYFDQIKKFGFESFRDIKHNILKSVVLNEIRPGILHTTNRLTLFIHEYGLFFTKEEHIMLIKLYIGIITTPKIDLPIVDVCCNLLVLLLKKFDKIERSELTIDWRPIYDLYMRVRKIDDNSSELSPENLEQHNLGDFIKCARVYFDTNATQEMLDEWRPMMCLFDTALNEAFMLFKLFLPTILYEHELRFGFALWAYEFLDFWSTFNTRQYWEAHFIRLYSRLAQDNIGLIDWSPYIPFIFSNLLKGFGLPFGSKDANTIESSNLSASTLNVMSHIFTYSAHEISSISVWIVSMIGSGANRNLCMQYIEKLFNSLRSYYYPSNVGSWTSNLMLFLKSLPDALIKRIRNERRSQNKWYHVSVDKACLINDEDRVQFVQALKDVTFTAMFSKSNQGDARKALQYLTFLRGDIMLPPLIDKINESFTMLNEPHRYTSILSCMVSVSRELTTFNPRHKMQTQLHVLNLLNAVLPGLDPNDSNKCILSLQFISIVLGSVLVCDCSSAINYRADLSEHERELCFETSKFEDFIHEFFKRIFNIIENLASDTSAESSASATAASTQFAIKNKGSDENAYQAYILQTVRILTRQSSKSFLKLILNKMKNFINGNSYNIRTGRMLASICGSLARSGLGHVAFDTFLNYVYENLSKLKHSSTYEQALRNERGDLEVTWNLQLLSELLKCDGTIIANHMDRIGTLIGWYRDSINKETFGFIGNCFRELLLSLTHIYPKETCLVDYSLMYDDEKEFFAKHLPIRDWSRRANIYRLNISYHVPSSKELQCAIEFLTLNLNKCEQFLNKSILTEANTLTTSTKEERHREFAYINYLVYGSSRLLKRPSSRPYVNDQIDSSIDVGLSDDVNKGLGFEALNLNNPEHECFNLSKEHKDTLLSLREHIINLMIKYSERLLEKHSHEVALLSQITQILCTSDVIYGYHLSEYEKMWKAYFANQSLLKNKLYGKRSCLRDELINRIMLHYQLRMFHIHTRLSDLDIRVIDTLFKLSVDSVYAVVRRNAQNSLFSILSHYPYSNLILLPKLTELLRRCSDPLKENRLTHDQLKGCLYILKGNSSHESLVIRPNWFVLSTYWPLLLRIQNVEKPSAQALLDKIYYNANKEFDSFDNRIQLSDLCVKLALEADAELRANYANNESLRLEQFKTKSQKDTEMIRGLMSEMISIANESQLSWKNQSTSFGSIIFLLNSCQMTPDLLTTEVIQLFTNSLVHENINVRKIALDTICILLKMVKPTKFKQTYETFQVIREETQNAINDASQIAINKATPGYREDNKWHFYDPNFVQSVQNLQDEQEERKWQNTHFLDKTYWGYYCWPSQLNVNVNKRQSFHSEENLKNNPFGQAIRPLIDKFKNDAQFIQKFIQLSTIEQSKGNEKFDKKKFYLFKSLFRNYGSCEIFNNLFEHLNALITDKKTETQECSHKLAAELLSGLIRGSKYWPLRQLKELWGKLRPILDLMVDNLSNENIGLWSSCWINVYEDQDPRRLFFFVNYFRNLVKKYFDETNFSSEKMEFSMNISSAQQSNILQLLSPLSQFEWRIPQFWSGLLETLQNNMSHPYKSTREKIGQSISLCLWTNVDYTSRVNNYDSKTILPSSNMSDLKKFIDFLVAKLNQSIELFDYVNEDSIDGPSSTTATSSNENYKSPQHLSAINFLHSLFAWFGYYVLRTYQPLNMELMRIIPQLCSVDKIAAQEVALKSQLSMIRRAFSVWLLNHSQSLYFTDQLKHVIGLKSWHSRLAAVQMVQNFGVFNIFLIQDENKIRIKEIILNSLTDEQLEVRQSACLTLTGFIHSGFVNVDQELVEHLKKLSKIKAKSKDKETGKVSINMPNLIKRHGGILGLCSIVNSSPYDVPSYLPDVVTYLCHFINDPVPIQGSIRKCLSEFRRTHHDNWQEHKLSFDESQLSILADILISPNYYA